MSGPFSSPRFLDAALAARFAAHGFCTLPLLGTEAVRDLAAGFHTLLDGPRSGFLSTIMQPPPLRKAAHRAILPHIARALAPHLGGFRIALCSFVARYPGSDQKDLPLHQDWSFVDERIARSISIWIPLQAVDAANGCLTVVPGSHRHEQPPRGIGSGFRYRSLEPQLRARHLVDVPMAAGEAIFFDHRLIHGSRCNGRPETRLAVGAVLLPEGNPLVVGLPRKRGGYMFRKVSDSFLLDADFATTFESAWPEPGGDMPNGPAEMAETGRLWPDGLRANDRGKLSFGSQPKQTSGPPLCPRGPSV